MGYPGPPLDNGANAAPVSVQVSIADRFCAKQQVSGRLGMPGGGGGVNPLDMTNKNVIILVPVITDYGPLSLFFEAIVSNVNPYLVMLNQ